VFFTKAGTVIAWLLFVSGALSYTIVLVAVWTDNIAMAQETFGARFMASSGNSLELIAIGVAFGIAAEISRAIAAHQK